jgi:large subunit ribosomal protein L17
MRHAKRINHLGRKTAHRKAMLANMASSLILKKRIFTTLAKAKALRTVVEPLITKSKADSTHSRRMVFSFLQDKHAVTELFREVSTKVGQRPGGYTRILKTGSRLGDNAEMCMIELVDYNENMLGTAKDTKAKAKTTRRGAKTKTKAAAIHTPKTTAKVKTEEVEEKLENPPVEEKKETPKKTKTKKQETENTTTDSVE